MENIFLKENIMSESTEPKVDKRTKEYREWKKQQDESQEIKELKQQVAELTELVKTTANVAANTAKTVKTIPSGRGGPQKLEVKRPRQAEFKILKDFLSKYAGAVAYEKDYVTALGVAQMYHRVDELLYMISKSDFLTQKALEDGITTDFKTVIVNKD